METFFSDLADNLQNYYNSLVVLLPKLVLALLVFTFLFYLANRSRKFVSRRLAKEMDDLLLVKFIARLVKITLVVVALLIALKILGLTDIATGIITGASVSAIVVGFAFKDIGENLLAGVMLAFNRPFRIGDVVELSGHQGKIVSLNVRDTQIKTFDGKDIYIPNASIVKSPVINYTIDGFLRNELDFGIDYGSDVAEAMHLIMEVVNTTPGVLQEDKKPTVTVSDMGSSALILKVYYWLDTFDPKVSGLVVKTEIIKKVLAALMEKGFNLPGDVIELKNYNSEQLKMVDGSGQKTA